jgi:hypothetical protein
MTNDQMEQFDIVLKKCIDGSITMKQAILQLRDGEKFKDISWIIFYIWLSQLQNSHVQGFQQIQPPHQG